MDIRKIAEMDLKLLNMRNALLFNKVGNVKQESIVDSLGGLEIPESVLKLVNSKIEDDYALIKKL